MEAARPGKEESPSGLASVIDLADADDARLVARRRERAGRVTAPAAAPPRLPDKVEDPPPSSLGYGSTVRDLLAVRVSPEDAAEAASRLAGGPYDIEAEALRDLGMEGADDGGRGSEARE